jgi:hypothetical protein
VLAISAETLHQFGSALDDSGPSRKVIADLVKGFVTDAVEEVLTVDEIA